MVLTIKIKIEDTVVDFTLQETELIYDLKTKISNHSQWKGNKTDYVDLFYEEDTPIRGMGKYNIEKGKFISMYDTFELNKFNFNSRLEFHLVARKGEATQEKFYKRESKTENSSKSYRAPIHRKTEKEFEFDLNDFPEL